MSIGTVLQGEGANVKKGSLINLLLVIIALLLILVCGLSVRLGAVPDRVTFFQVDGMTCENCSAAICGMLGMEKGVTAVDVDRATGRVAVGYASREAATPESLAELINHAGYRCRMVRTQTVAEYRAANGDDTFLRKRAGSSCPVRHRH
jgi:copper chaperone CopZ